MLGVSAMMGASGDAAQPEPRESGAASDPAGAGVGGAGEVGVAAQTSAAGLSEEDKLRMEEVDRSSGGNRWPRQETLALLKIRSDMGAAFRDSSLKGPLWEEVSRDLKMESELNFGFRFEEMIFLGSLFWEFRKLAELGYHRSAKKCKEKFENVLKYHKRTKEGRAMKPDAKTYRFFDQLEALENQPPPPPLLPPPRPPPQAMPVAVAIPANNPPIASQTTVPSTANPITTVATGLSPINPLPPPPQQQPAPAATAMAPNPISFCAIPASHGPNMAVNFGSISTSSSSSTSSDEEPERRLKRKRKWESFFQRLMNEVISKQEEMQKNFLETLERRERDRMAREEAWRVQEMARMNREHDLLVQERSMAAAKDAAVIAFLQKVSDQQIPNVAQLQAQMQAPPPPQPPPPPAVAQPQQQPQPPQPLPVQPQPQGPIQATESFGNPKSESFSSSRWPKVEVQALIKIRTSLDNKYQENGPKGPLWEEISASMAKLGYNRSAKRCKEKWENINKYFKKVKESNKKRPEDSKTCPYFHQLDALYREKARNETTTASFNPAGFNVKSENPMVPIMVQPEQQWPMPQDMRPPEAGTEDQNSNNDDEDDDEEDEEEEDEAGGYEIVTNKPSSVGTGDE